MAARVRNYRQADTGDLGKYIGGKIKAARKMAAQEREANKESGVETGRGYFFGKALAAEFGGDKLRRTKGMFQVNPDEQNDPGLSKKERYQKMIRGEIKNAPGVTQLGLEGIRDDEFVQDAPLQSWLTPILNTISDNTQKVAEGIKGLGNKQDVSSDQQDTTNNNLGNFASLLDRLKQWIKRDIDIAEDQVEVEVEQGDLFKQAQNDAEAARNEADIESKAADPEDNPNRKAEDDDDDEGGGGGLLGGLVSGLTDAIGEIASELGADALGDKLRRNKKPKTPDAPKTPKPKAPTPPGKGRLGSRILGAGKSLLPALGGFGRKMMSEGTRPEPTIQSGLYTNPTKGRLDEDKGVYPLNRNNGVSDLLGKAKDKSKTTAPVSEEQKPELVAKLVQAIPMAGGALTFSIINQVLQGIAGPFAAPILNTFKPIAKAFGLPETILNVTAGSDPTAAEGAEGNAVGEKGITHVDGKALSGKRGKKKGILGRISDGLRGMFGGLFGRPAAAATQPTTQPRYRPPAMAAAETVGNSKKFTRSMFGRGLGVRDNLGSGRNPGGHTGLDIGVPENEKISIGYPGTVVDAAVMGDANDHSPKKDNGGYGNFAVIKLDAGGYIKLAHFNTLKVTNGQKVKAGDVIGLAGSTGLSTGPHVHIDHADGYNKSTASFRTYGDPSQFVLNGGIQYGGNTTSPNNPRVNIPQGQPLLTSNTQPLGVPTSMSPSMGQPQFIMLPAVYQTINASNTPSSQYTIGGNTGGGLLTSPVFQQTYQTTTRGNFT